jgi:hypothetical protein
MLVCVLVRALFHTDPAVPSRVVLNAQLPCFASVLGGSDREIGSALMYTSIC